MLTTKDRIRQEAIRLFAERGIDAVSQRDIAAAAGVQVSTLYTHWTGGRDQLIGELFVAGYTDYATSLHAAAEPHATFAAALDAMVRAICRLHGEDRAMFAFLLLGQHRGLDRVGGGEAANPVDVLQRRVKRAMQAYEIPRGEPALITAAIVGVLVQAATFHLYGRLAQDLPAMADALACLCARVAGLPTAPRTTR
ncbi:MAG: fadR [Rhodospirillales bacterium]|nr:fadR [Rhodospirillales bacterium]